MFYTVLNFGRLEIFIFYLRSVQICRLLGHQKVLFCYTSPIELEMIMKQLMSVGNFICIVIETTTNKEEEEESHIKVLLNDILFY